MKLEWQFANFVKKSVPRSAAWKRPILGSHRARERAALMSEKVGLEQCGGNSRAVDRDEPVLPAGAGLVNRSCDQLPCRYRSPPG